MIDIPFRRPANWSCRFVLSPKIYTICWASSTLLHVVCPSSQVERLGFKLIGDLGEAPLKVRTYCMRRRLWRFGLGCFALKNTLKVNPQLSIATDYLVQRVQSTRRNCCVCYFCRKIPPDFDVVFCPLLFSDVYNLADKCSQLKFEVSCIFPRWV